MHSLPCGSKCTIRKTVGASHKRITGVLVEITSRPHACGESGVCVYRFWRWAVPFLLEVTFGALKATLTTSRSPIPGKSAKIIIKTSIWEPHGILKRMTRMKRIHRKRNIRCRTDPAFPTPGVRITVVYTNSLKLRKGGFGTYRICRNIWKI